MIQEAIKTKEYHINIADKAERFLNECIAEWYIMIYAYDKLI
jgi:hypothetical protein